MGRILIFFSDWPSSQAKNLSLLNIFSFRISSNIVYVTCRVSRVLQMPRGNILMVGMGGSGRRSSCRLAAHIADCKLMTVQVTKTYTQQDWRDDLKKILMSSGFSMNHTVFLFSDSQVRPCHQVTTHYLCIPYVYV